MTNLTASNMGGDEQINEFNFRISKLQKGELIGLRSLLYRIRRDILKTKNYTEAGGLTTLMGLITAKLN